MATDAKKIAEIKAKRQLKTPKTISQYYRKIAEMMEKYGKELMEIAKEN